MIAPALLSLLLAAGAASPAAGAACTVPTDPVGANAELERLYRAGTPFADFLADATRRKAMWRGHYGEGEVPAELVGRARAVPGHWYLLAVAVDSCSDSVNTIPYLALLEERVPGLEMRIVSPRAGRAVMEARRTPDGRAATPTVVLLDANFDDAGCFIERPRDLQAWWIENGGKIDRDELFRGKMAWYDDDAGRSTLVEVVELMEAAAAGAPRCDASE